MSKLTQPDTWGDLQVAARLLGKDSPEFAEAVAYFRSKWDLDSE